MIGHEGVASALVTLLRDRGEPAARLVEQDQGLEPGSIVVPKREHIYPTWRPVVAKGDFPSWMVVGLDTPIRRTGQRRNVGTANDETEWRYPFMVMTHVSDDAYGRVAAARYRLMLVIRTILIQTPGLINRGDGEVARIDLSEAQERLFGQETVPETLMHIGEGHNLFHVTTQENTPIPQQPWGAVAGFDIGVDEADRPTTDTPEG